MKTMAAGNFKTHCLSVIDDVYEQHEEVIITKHGKPMARLVPLEEKKKDPGSIFGFMKGKVRIIGDIVSPIIPEEDWDPEIFPPSTSKRSK
jgi:prevent-host-death family protein